MPFDFSNMSASFQDYINNILIEKLYIFIVIYLNDILIYIKDFGQPYVNVIW